MPDSKDRTTPENIIQNVVLNIQSTISGPDAAEHFQKIKTSTDKARKALKPAIAQFKKLAKQLGSRTYKVFAKTQKLIGVTVKNTTGFITRQTRRLRDQHQQMRRNVRVNRSFTDSFLKMTAVVGGLTLALRTLQKFANSRLDVRLLGVDLARLEKLLAGTGLRDSLTFDLISQFGQLGLPQQVLAQNDTIQKGLIEFQKAFSGLGQQRANQLIIDLARSVPEPSRLVQLFSTAASGAVKDALLGAQDDRSIGEVLRGLNALTAQKEIAEGKASPALEAAIKTQQSLDAMSAAVENTSKKLITEFAPAITKAASAMESAAERISKMESSTVKTLGVLGIVGAGLAAVGSVVGTALLGFKGLSIAKGALGLAAGSTQALPVIKGFAAKRVAEVSGRGLAARGTGALARVPQVAALAGVLSFVEGIVNLARGKNLQDATTVGRVFGENVIDPICARRNRQANQRHLKDVQRIRRSGLIDRAREAQQPIRQFAQEFLNDKIKDFAEAQGITDPATLQDKFDSLRRSFGITERVTLQLTKATKKQSEAADKAVTPVKAVSQAIKSLGATAASVDPLTQALRRSVTDALDLEKASALQASITDLRRLERDIAAANPIGQLAALPQLQALQDAQRQDLQAIQKQLENLVITGPDSEIRANRLRSQQLQILLRMRQDTQALVNSFDLFGQVIGASGSVFSKILITSKKNLAVGLQKNIIRSPIQQITGSLIPKRLRPRTLADLGITSPFHVLPQRPVLPKRPKTFVPNPTAPPRAATPTPTVPPAPSPQQSQVIQSVQRQTTIAQRQGRLSPTERIQKRIGQREERIMKLISASIEGFKDKGVSDSLRRARQIASSQKNIEKDRARIERIRQRTSEVKDSQPRTLTPTAQELAQREQIVEKRHPKARRLTYTGVGGAQQKLETAGQLLIEAAHEMEEEETTTEPRGDRPSASESNVITN